MKRVNTKRRKSEFARCYHSKARVEWVKGFPCVECTKGPSENAHIASRAGAGRKGDYAKIVPLCPRCHRMLGTPRGARWMECAAFIEATWQAHLARTS